MKLRSKILIFLLTTLLVLVVLISLLFVMILRLKFNYDDSLNPNSQRGFASIDNSVKYISVKTERDCKEIRSFIEERKDISAIIEALEKNRKICGKNPAMFIYFRKISFYMELICLYLKI